MDREVHREGIDGDGCACICAYHIYICIHVRRLIIINPCLLPTVINLYSSPALRDAAVRRRGAHLNIPIDPKPESRARNKGSSSLIYARRINLPLSFLGFLGFLSASFFIHPGLRRPICLLSVGGSTRSTASLLLLVHLGNRRPSKKNRPATPIMRGCVILCKYFP